MIKPFSKNSVSGDIMDIYRMQFYEYNTYSYSGIVRSDDKFFSSLAKAAKYAMANNLRMVENVNNPEIEVTLEKIDIE